MNKMENKKITFKDLSLPLKIAFLGSWAWIILVSLMFIFGFLSGIIMGYLGP